MGKTKERGDAMRISLWVRQEFDAAHSLSGLFPDMHKCSNVHGHRYEVTVWLSVEDQGDDLVVDYHDMHRSVADVIAKVDHKYLNDVIKIPTCENLARWFWKNLYEAYSDALEKIEVQEQSMTGCTLEKERGKRGQQASPPKTSNRRRRAL